MDLAEYHLLSELGGAGWDSTKSCIFPGARVSTVKKIQGQFLSSQKAGNVKFKPFLGGW